MSFDDISLEEIDAKLQNTQADLDKKIFEHLKIKDVRIGLSLLQSNYKAAAGLINDGLERADRIESVEIKADALQMIAKNYNDFRDELRKFGLDLG